MEKMQRQRAMIRAIWLACLLIATLLLATVIIYRGPVTETAVQNSNVVSNVPAGNTDDPARRSSKNRSARDSLPVVGTPLRDVYGELTRQSNDGSASASLRLFRDLTTCKNREAKIALTTYYLYAPKDETEQARNARTQELGQLTNVTKNALQQLESSDNLCEGISEDQINNRAEFLRQAAIQGDPQAMACYAASTFDVGPKYLSGEWFDYVERWESEAPQFAQQAFEAGNASALPLLIDALAPNDPTIRKAFQFSQLVAPNPRSVYVLALLFERLSPESQSEQAHNEVVRLANGLQPDEISSAKTQADELWPRFSQNQGNENNARPCGDLISP